MACDESTPCVVIISCSDDLRIQKITRLVVGDVELKDSNDEFSSCAWHIDTKYYEATIDLVFVPRKGISRLTRSGSDLNRAGGLVIYYDGRFDEISDDVKALADRTDELYNVGVKLLVCDSSSSDDSRSSVVEWCAGRGFEHLELTGDEGDEDRLKQALEAHIWPNLVTKSSGSSSADGKQQKDDASKKDQEFDDFSTLFGQLALMKEQAASMAPDERKNFAEQVVLAYWRSIGGDEDELLDV